MNNAVTFARLRKTLTGLGFMETVVPGSHVVFEHHPSETLLAFREYKNGEKVNRGDLAVTRRFLVEKGLVEEEQLESMLQAAAV